MKKILILTVSLALVWTVTAQQNGQQKSLIDLSSTDKFFEIADKISLNQDISEDDWNDLFSTSGYSIVGFNRVRRTVHRDMLTVAFSNNQQIKRDSILNLSMEDLHNDMTTYLARLTLINFLDIKENQKELRLFREMYNFDAIIKLSVDRLKSFLIQSVDSLVVFPSIALICNESGAWFSPSGIAYDFNFFYNSGEEGRANILAHEMFHTYRANFVNWDIQSSLFQVLSKLQDEGIADLINKKDIESFFELGTPQEFKDFFVSTYDNTPQILNDLDVIVRSFINKEISEEQFNEKIEETRFNSHANGYYMAQLIKDAGILDEMLKTFYSPVEFVKLYNKAAKKNEIYVLSNEFIQFAENLEKNELADDY
jgi:hypothetical protein